MKKVKYSALILLVGLPAMAQVPMGGVFTTTSQGLVPAPGSTANQVLGQTGWTTMTGGGNVSTDSAGTISAQVVRAANGATNRTLATRSSDIFNAKDFGALGTGAATTIGTTYGANLAALAAYSNGGSTPFSWATNAAFGLTFTMTTSAAQSSAGTTLTFISPTTYGGVLAWAAQFAQWQDPATRNYLVAPGMLVSGSCIASNTTIGTTTTGLPTNWSIPAVPVRQTDLLQAPGTTTTWASGTPYSVGQVRIANSNAYRVTAGGTSGGTAPSGAGTFTDGSVTWSYIAAASSLPAETDWAPSTLYSPGAIVAANGGTWIAITAGASAAGTVVASAGTVLASNYTFGGPAYGGSYGQPWQASYIGTSVADGGVTWLLLNRKEYRNLPLGKITLSAATTSACPAGSAITFTISPSQLAGLTMDWLGIQTAVAQAYAAGQGEVVLPAGTYESNHQITNPAQTGNSAVNTPQISVRGAGPGATNIVLTSDLGQDQCAIAETFTQASYMLSNTHYHDFELLGPNFNRAIGSSPNLMDGLCIGQHALATMVTVQFFHAGLVLSADHQSFNRINLTNNGFNLLFGSYGTTMGNQSLDHTLLAGSLMASVGVMPTNQIDSSDFNDVHTGFGPWGFYLPPVTPNVTVANPGFVTGSNFFDVWMESEGEEFVRAINASGYFVGNRLVGGGSQGSVGNVAYRLSNGVGGTVQPKSVYYVNYYEGNTNTGTKSDDYALVSDALYETVYDCTDNLWVNDVGVVYGNQANSMPSASVPVMKCTTSGSGNVANNRFVAAHFSGGFHHAGNGFTWSTGQPLKFVDNGDYAAPYSDGAGFFGVAAAPCMPDNISMCPVQTEGPVAMTTVTAIGTAQPVFATSSGGLGIQSGLDQNGAIGIAQGSCPAGTTNCTIMLIPGAHGGAPGAAPGLTATGTTQATAYQITSASSQFTSVPSGSGAILGLVPVGATVTIYNDGVNSLAVYPQVGGNFTGYSVNTPTSLAAGATVTYRRMSATVWR